MSSTGPWSSKTITHSLKSVSFALPDVTLTLDIDGVIRSASLANSVSSEIVDSWLGCPWVDTVGDAAGATIRAMVADARANGVSDFRQITQRFPSGLELPMEYNTVRLGGRAGLIAVGKNLQAVAVVQSKLVATHHAREQDAWKLREVETRNRLLFESSDDPILLLRTDDLSIVEANPAAIRAGALDAGRDFPAVILPRDQTSFRAMMAQVGAQGRAQGILIHLGAAGTPWLVRASRAITEPEAIFLLRLSPAAPTPPAPEPAALEDLIERLPDGFTLVDAAGMVLRANQAFLDLVQCPVHGGVVGQPIGNWLTQPGADAAVLLASVRRHRVVRNFATSIHGALGGEAAVEISCAGDRDSAPSQIALIVRDVTRRPNVAQTDRGMHIVFASLAGLTDQIGRTPLLQMVRDAGDLIEQHCIEAALDRVDGNRTAAASLLGLSRQSLYAKLNRYGVGGVGGEAITGN
jgi:transcriptional regulator PpsR